MFKIIKVHTSDWEVSDSLVCQNITAASEGIVMSEALNVKFESDLTYVLVEQNYKLYVSDKDKKKFSQM